MSTDARRLLVWRVLARLVLILEVLGPALGPPAGVLGGLAAAALLGLPGVLPAWLHLAGLLGGAAVAAVLLVRGLRTLRWPDRAAADRRLEHDSGLEHRPLAVLDDRPSGEDGAALWAAHVARSLRQIRRLHLGPPRPGMARRDPMALRALVVVVLAASLAVAGGDAPARLGRALHPAWTKVPAPLASQVRAWITPPSYTGLAPLFLKADSGAVRVPAGARLSVSVTGGSGTPVLTLGGGMLPVQALDAASFQAEAELTRGGRLAVRQGGREIGAWELEVQADAAPELFWPEPPGRARNGSTRFPWAARHAYGVTALGAELHLRDRPGAAPLVVPVPLPDGPVREARGMHLQDLTAHPWAGLTVVARLVGRDAAGLEGRSAGAEFVLPERVFENPAAQVLVAARRRLSRDPDDRATPLGALDALAGMDALWAADPAGYLVLRTAEALLREPPEAAAAGEPPPVAVGEAQDLLWNLALRLEDGVAARTAEALAAARQAAEAALGETPAGETPDRDALERQMRALQEALGQHLRALAEQALRHPDAQDYDPNAHRLDARDMLRLAERMRAAAAQGRMDEARQAMAELGQMLDEMAEMRGPPQTSGHERQRAARRAQGQREMGALEDIVRRLGTLLDHAQRRVAGAGGGDQRPADARTESALRRALGVMMQQFGALTGQVPPRLGEADLAMRDAVRALQAGNGDAAAAAATRRAIDALQKGGQEMGRQLTAQFGAPSQAGEAEAESGAPGEAAPGENGARPGEEAAEGSDGPGDAMEEGNGEGRDPLGRRPGQASDGQGGVHLPEQMERMRAAILQEELRRRAAERSRPQPELDYLDRLLRPF